MAVDQEGMESYALARKRIKGEAQASSQKNSDALARRFASLGNLNSGARIKIEQKARDEDEGRLNNALEGVTALEGQELARRREIEKGREFQTSERLGGQEFISGEAGRGREFSRGERLGSQEFVSGESALGRRFQTGEREAGQQFARGEREAGQQFASGEAGKQREFQGGQMAADREIAVRQLDTAIQQFNDTFGEEVRVNKVNEDLARRVLDQKGILDKLLDPDIGGGVGGFAKSVGVGTLLGGGIGGTTVGAAKTVGKLFR